MLTTIDRVNTMKDYTISLLEELIIKYVELEWDMQFVTWFVNSKWEYVTLQEKSDSTWIDYSIRWTMLDSEYWSETEIEWWEVIFQFNNDYYWRDIDEIDIYKSDYQDYLKDKKEYIQEKLDYIISLTW